MINEFNCSYIGHVFHKRFVPIEHAFKFNISTYFLDISGDENKINTNIINAKMSGVFQRKNYFGDKAQNLDISVLNKASELSGRLVQGKVFMLGQVKHLGYYFSPVNFYFIQNLDSQKYEYMLAEVTNTPWNEKFCYLLDLSRENIHDKAFHVSPFNPMDLVYTWKVLVGKGSFMIQISCLKNNIKHFEALMKVDQDLSNRKNPLFINFKIILGIYLHALFLFFKRAPFYSHPSSK